MVMQLIWVAVIYGLAIAWIHGMYHITHKRKADHRKNKVSRYILITCNHESQVEWYVRALWLYAYLRNKEVYLLVIDDASSDETVRIVQRMSDFSGLDLTLRVCSGDIGVELSNVGTQEELEEFKLIDLRIPQEARHIPYVQG
ncbi:hypothetical protein [Paenibacillus crassostreae]|uniref:Uncharacterized protein n=1 Tax=Paenibacillus crassostreae TaxID=1763538 RepID=A0A162KUB7_9BACL|nr:hypothetical protein [Paenibacillus crassostreae]AOZ93230.1 hypothetical protein LPB68_14100 [Paenibacillus crassostreae]OAB74053.1 hypothetical protein PNBC_12940 [Paenibacillus crassostreae]